MIQLTLRVLQSFLFLRPSQHPGNMAIDSKVAFQTRALELGIDQLEVDALDAAGINSYVTYAYCSTCHPGQNDDTALIGFLATTLGNAPSAASTTRSRRLFFEVHALSLEDLKSRADRSESSDARIIPLAEKMDTIRMQKQRLIGLSFTPQSDPSHSLIDRVCQQLEDNVITYSELNRCSSRHDDASHPKIDTSLALDNSGGLRLSKKQKLDDVNVTGGHKQRQAFLRRTGADKPFDVAFEKFSEHPEVLQHLTPLQSVGGQKHDASNTLSTTGKGKGFHHLDGKGKSAKGKGKPNTGMTVPDDCEIFVDGKQLCRHWQVGRCTAKIKPGKRCVAGYHMCWRKSCHKFQPGNECPH